MPKLYKILIVCFIALAINSNTSYAQGVSVNNSAPKTNPCPDNQFGKAIGTIQKEDKDKRKETNAKGMPASEKKIADFSCLKDIWSGGNFPSLGGLLDMLKGGVCGALQGIADGALDAATGLVSGAIDGAVGAAGSYLTAQTEALTGGLTSNLEMMDQMTSERGIKNRVDSVIGPSVDEAKTKYKTLLFN